MHKIAIAILNYNGKEYLEKFLPALVANTPNTPIYIGDNNSTDSSVSFLKTKYPAITCIELGSNFGYSKGYNLLLRHINAEFVALVNSDIEVTPNWLAPLQTALHTNPDWATVQPKIKSHLKKDYFEYAGACGGYIDKYGYPFCRGRLFNTLEKDKGQYDTQVAIGWSSGACFVVRKSYFAEVGGFDDTFFAHMEEIDFCWRLAHKGYFHYFIPESTVYHVGGATLSYASPFKTYLNFRNGLYLLYKNLPPQQLTKILLVRIVLDWLSAIYYLVQGKGSQSMAVWKAHIKVWRTKKAYKNKHLQPSNGTNYRKPYSIVWQYFIKKIKTYSALPNK